MLTRIHQSFHSTRYPRFCPLPERPIGEEVPISAYNFETEPLIQEKSPMDVQELLDFKGIDDLQLKALVEEHHFRTRIKRRFRRVAAYLFKKETPMLLSKKVLCEEGIPSFYKAAKKEKPKPRVFRRYVDPLEYKLPKYKCLKQQMENQLPYDYPDTFGNDSDCSSIEFEENVESFGSFVGSQNQEDQGKGGEADQALKVSSPAGSQSQMHNESSLTPNLSLEDTAIGLCKIKTMPGEVGNLGTYCSTNALQSTDLKYHPFKTTGGTLGLKIQNTLEKLQQSTQVNIVASENSDLGKTRDERIVFHLSRQLGLRRCKTSGN